MTEQVIPEGSTPITTEELLATIGELTVQVRVLRRMLGQKVEAEGRTNGVQTLDRN
jgi:hypothetical protein